MDISCPHCNAPNSNGARFCTTCGKAVPAAAPAGPRVLRQADLAGSSAGQSIQLVALAKQSRTAVRTMGWLAGIQLVLGALLVVGSLALPVSAADARGSLTPEKLALMLGTGIVLGFIGLVFTGLAFWARKSPLPAAITGLVLFVSLWALDAALILMGDHPEEVLRGVLIKLIIVGLLGRAVSASLKHRALVRTMAAEQPSNYRAAA